MRSGPATHHMSSNGSGDYLSLVEYTKLRNSCHLIGWPILHISGLHFNYCSRVWGWIVSFTQKISIRKFHSLFSHKHKHTHAYTHSVYLTLKNVLRCVFCIIKTLISANAVIARFILPVRRGYNRVEERAANERVSNPTKLTYFVYFFIFAFLKAASGFCVFHPPFHIKFE